MGGLATFFSICMSLSTLTAFGATGGVGRRRRGGEGSTFVVVISQV